MTLQRKFKKSEKIVSRRVADEFVLVPICRSTKEVESIYTLNEVAARIWELMDSEENLENIVGKIVGEFDVSQDEARQDMEELFDELEAIKAIEKVD